MSEAEFRSTLDPAAIVNNRQTSGGPQPAEMERMIRDATQRVAQQDGWIKARREQISGSLARLDADFEKLGEVR
jgi:argininosuccinate lyase